MTIKGQWNWRAGVSGSHHGTGTGAGRQQTLAMLLKSVGEIWVGDRKFPWGQSVSPQISHLNKGENAPV